MSTEPHLLISTNVRSLQFWYPAVGRLKCEVDLRTHARFAVFSPDATKIAAPYAYGTEGRRKWNADSIIIISAADAAPLKTIRLNENLRGLSSAAWLPSGDNIAISGGGVIQVTNVNDGAVVAQLRGHGMAVVGIDAAADGRFIASVCEGHELRIWCGRTWKLLWKHTFGGVTHAVSLFPDGSRVVVGCGDGNAYVLSVSGGSGQIERGEAMVLEHGDWAVVGDVKVSPDMLTIATCPLHSGPIVYVWDANRGDKLAEFLSPHNPYRICFSPDNRYLACGSSRGAIAVWEIDGDQEQPVAVLAGDSERHRSELTSMAFAPSGGMGTGIVVQQNGSDQSDGRRERKDAQ